MRALPELQMAAYLQQLKAADKVEVKKELDDAPQHVVGPGVAAAQSESPGSGTRRPACSLDARDATPAKYHKGDVDDVPDLAATPGRMSPSDALRLAQSSRKSPGTSGDCATPLAVASEPPSPRVETQRQLAATVRSEEVRLLCGAHDKVRDVYQHYKEKGRPPARIDGRVNPAYNKWTYVTKDLCLNLQDKQLLALQPDILGPIYFGEVAGSDGAWFLGLCKGRC